MILSQVCTQELPPLALKAWTAADLMSSRPVSIQETATVHEAAAFLSERGISAAPVINVAGAPVGVLSQTDLVIHQRERDAFAAGRGRIDDLTDFDSMPLEPQGVWRAMRGAMPEDDARVRDVMTPTVFTVRPDTPAARVVEDMLALRVHRLFVVDGDGVLIGVVTATDVLRRLEPTADDAA